MGSSIGNFEPQEAVNFLKGYAQVLGPQDLMVIGLDACQDEKRVFHAYNDREGTTHEFILNGLVHANRLFGKEVFKQDDWQVLGRYDTTKQCHQAFYKANNDVSIEGVHIKRGEKIRVEESYKYSTVQSRTLWRSAGLMPKASFGNPTDDFRK